MNIIRSVSISPIGQGYIPVLQYSNPSAMVKASSRMVSAPASCMWYPEMEMELNLGMFCNRNIDVITQHAKWNYYNFLHSYWHTRVGWKVHRLTMMQWSNLTKCGLFSNIVSPAVHTLLPSVLQRLDSCGIEAIILILQKVLNCKSYLIIDLILLPSQVFFSYRGIENSQMVPNQENMEGDQPVQSHSHAQQP